MTKTESARFRAAISRMTVEMSPTMVGEWFAEIHTFYFGATGDVKLVHPNAYGSTPEGAFRNAMKQLRWELRDAPVKVTA